jgi:hypothetical protein
VPCPASLLACAFALACVPAWAQIPDTFKNLRVLPKDIAKPDIVGTMRGWATELGVRCTHCHVGPDNLQGMDFASDDKPTKRAAREMLRMVQSINAGTLKSLPPREAPRQAVSCVTCHRGAARPPLTLHEELVRAAQAGGPAALERYRELRRDHYADGQYDFGPRSLAIAADRLLDAGRADEALALARLAVEQHPDLGQLHALLGHILLEKGERAAAGEALRKALALDPQNVAAKRELERLEQKPKP